jgi:hypothetical protein
VLEKKGVVEVVEIIKLIQEHEKEKLTVTAAVHLDRLKTRLDELKSAALRISSSSRAVEDNESIEETPSNMEWYVENSYKANRLKELEAAITEQVNELQAFKCDNL